MVGNDMKENKTENGNKEYLGGRESLHFKLRMIHSEENLKKENKPGKYAAED
jgi:hypothetical protein